MNQQADFPSDAIQRLTESQPMKCTCTKQTTPEGRAFVDIPPEGKAALVKMLSKMKDGAVLDFAVDRQRKPRSERQHGYYFACLTELSEYTGMRVDDLHDFFKAKFLLDYSTGCEIPRIKSTKECSESDMSRYIDDVAQFCAETLDFVWPEPIGQEVQAS